MNFIGEDQVEKALDYLKNHAGAAAKARAERAYVEQFRNSIKAQIMGEFNDLATNAQERCAYADPRYIQHLEALRQAVFEDERHRFLREAALATIEAWRTQQATERAMSI